MRGTFKKLVTHPLTSYGDGTSLAVASILAMTTLGSSASFRSRGKKLLTACFVWASVEMAGQLKCICQVAILPPFDIIFIYEKNVDKCTFQNCKIYLSKLTMYFSSSKTNTICLCQCKGRFVPEWATHASLCMYLGDLKGPDPPDNLECLLTT